MCGRFAVTLPPEAMIELFRVLNSIEFPPRFNIAPTQPVVAIWEAEGRREARLARWGFMPGWVKDPREFPLVINAKAETMLDKPAFRTAIRHHRCIVPASGYYEWHTGPDGTKQPYYITLESGQPLAMAGLYSVWSGPEGEVVDTVATVTVAANSDLSDIHARMPAILLGDAVDAWLDAEGVPAKEAAQLALPLEPGLVKFHPVSKAVGSNRSEGPQLIAPVLIGEEPAKPAAPARRKAAAGGQLDLF